MKTLSAESIIASTSFSASPVTVMKISLLVSGDTWYATKDLSSPVAAQGRIAEVGALAFVMGRGEVEGESVRVTLRDEDGVLRGLMLDESFSGSAVVVYQHFDGLVESDMTPLVNGVVEDEPEWDEKEKVVRLRVSGLQSLFRNRTLGRRASRTEFEKLGKDEEGKMLPMVYGRPHRVKTVLVKGGAETELAHGVTQSDMEIAVCDASRFPSGAVTIRIGQEEMTGSFDGNRFLVTQRGCAIESGVVSDATDKMYLVRATGLTAAQDNQYAGCLIKATFGGKTQYRLVVQYVAGSGTLVLNAPFIGSDGKMQALSQGTAFSLTTVVSSHHAGEQVREVLDEYVYLVSDSPVESVDGVEGWGVVEPEIEAGGLKITDERRGYVTLPSRYYSVDVNDTTTFPALGRAVATLKVRRPPTQLAELKMLKDDLYVTVRGVPGSGGTALENPANIVRQLLVDEAGVSESDIDADSFDAAALARSDVNMAFCLGSPMPVARAISELCFQARLCLSWKNGKAALTVLDNALGAADVAFDDDAVELDSAKLQSVAEADVVTGFTANYTHRGEKAAVTVSDAAAENAFGANRREVDFWAFEARHQVLIAAEWWLRRLRHRYRKIRVTTFLPALAVETGDVVEVDHLPGGAVKGRVVALSQSPGSATDGKPERIDMTLQLSQWAGCASGCEHACETSACEISSCELSCTAAAEVGCVWMCETSCEENCQISCMSGCEITCQMTCQLHCRSDAQAFDSSCMSACESGCETACESVACETSCETGCEYACESAGEEVVSPIREVRVLTAPSSQYGAMTVIQSDRSGNDYGESFSVYDPFDIRPAAGDKTTVYLNFNYQWVVVPGRRHAKLVKILGSGSGSGEYSVIEQDASGTTWGDSFTASEIS